jgi:hypothetical protein
LDPGRAGPGGRRGAARWRPRSAPRSDSTVYNAKTFHQAASTSVTYYLNAQWTSGADSGDKSENSRLICTFYPD